MGDSRPTSDIEAYAGRYEGRGRINRLRFVADRSPELELDALRLAIDTAKAGKDTAVYKELVNQASGRLGAEYALDEEWVTTTDKWAAVQLERLRQELEDHRQQPNKEVVRAGHNDLGDFFLSRGKVANARGEYNTMRDYCTQMEHHVSMCLKIVLLSIESGEYGHVENYLHIAENGGDPETMPFEFAKLRCSAGLALLARGRYKDAALRLLSVPIDLSEDKAPFIQETFNDLFSLEDVATYVGLCALATLERPILLDSVLGNPAFRSLLELAPEIHELIRDFCATRYTACINGMERLKPDLLLDPFLGRDNHVDRLYSRIRAKALLQYVSPFESVDMKRMAEVFKSSIHSLEKEVLELIENGSVDFRVDTQAVALRRTKSSVRKTTLARAIRDGQQAFDDAEAMLLRMNLIKHDMAVSWQPHSLSRATSGAGPQGIRTSSVSDLMYNQNMAPSTS